MIKDQVLTALNSLGFVLEEIDPAIWGFDYEMASLLFFHPEGTNESITFFAPGVFKITHSNRTVALEAIATLCSSFKYIQPEIMMENQIWLSYHHYTGEIEYTQEDIEKIVHHSILALSFAITKFHSIINDVTDGN